MLKKILTFFLTLALVLAAGITQVPYFTFTAKAEENSESASSALNLDDGYYSTLVTHSTESIPGEGNLLLKAKGYTILGSAMIKAEGGKYTLTLRLANINSVKYFGVLKNEEALKDTGGTGNYSTYKDKLGTRGWITDVSDDKKSSYGAVEENDSYWTGCTYDKNKSTVSFSLDNVNPENIDVYEIYDNASTWTIDRDALSIDVNNLIKIDKEGFSNSKSVSFTGVYSSKVRKYFQDTDVSWTVSQDKATAVYKLTETGKKSKYSASYTPDNQEGTFDLSSGEISLGYDLSSYEDLALGKTIYFINGSSSYYATLIPRLMPPKEVTLTEESTGVQLVTTSDIVNEDASLVKEEVMDDPADDDDAYSDLNRFIDGIYNNIYMGTYKIKYSDGTTSNTTSKDVTLKFKIPDTWNKDNVQLARPSEPNVGGGKVETESDGSNYYVISTKTLGDYALYEKKTFSDADSSLENGTYTVPIAVINFTNKNVLSMASRCLGSTATLVVNGDSKILYMSFKPVTASIDGKELSSYMAKMWTYDSDEQNASGDLTGNLMPVIVTSYFKNEDGTYLTDYYNKNTLKYYPETGYMSLYSTKSYWPVRFSVPIMDAIGGGDYSQNAWLAIDWSNAKKATEEITPSAEAKKALGSIIELADSLDQSSYTTETWGKLKSALAQAKEIYNAAASTQAQQENAYSSLAEAVDGLKEGTPVDKSSLNTAIDSAKAEAAKTDTYTSDSIASLNAAITSAQTIADNADATQNEVDSAVTLLENAVKALTAKNTSTSTGENTYSIYGTIWNASNSTQKSMSDAAVTKPMQVKVTTDANGNQTAQLIMDFVPLQRQLGGTNFTGYLADLKYFQGYEGSTAPSGQTATDGTVISYYDVTDEYNQNSSLKYPKQISITLDKVGQENVWLQVYVPVMEAISSGSGTQLARLELDWSGIDTGSGTQTNTNPAPATGSNNVEVKEIAVTGSTETSTLSGETLANGVNKGVDNESSSIIVTAKAEKADNVTTSEVVIPADTAKALSGSGKEVEINASAGTVTFDNTLMKAAASVNKEIKLVISKSDESYSGLGTFSGVYNITLEDKDGNTVSFSGGKAKVSVAVSGNVNYAYCISDGSITERVAAATIDGRAVFTVSHFSTWALGSDEYATKDETTPSSETPETETQEPETDNQKNQTPGKGNQTPAAETNVPASDNTKTNTKTSDDQTTAGEETLADITDRIETAKSDNELSSSKFGLLKARSTKQAKKSVTVKWKKVKGTAVYTIFGAKCGGDYKLLGTTVGTSYKNTSLKKGTYYKYIVVASDSNGKVITTSKVVHAATKGGKVTNYKSVKLKSKKKVTIKTGKTSRIKASLVKAKKGSKVKKHTARLRYESSDTSIAVVNSNGKITAKKKGTCKIYVYAQNGVYKTVTVKVK